MACYQARTIYIGLIFILLGLNLTFQYYTVNVAFQKGVLLCSADYISETLTNGNRIVIVETTDVSGCDEYVFLKITMNMHYYLQYAILFPGNIVVAENDDHVLNYFYVDMNEPSVGDCGMFPKPLKIIKNFTKGLRINCIKSDFVYAEVAFNLNNLVPFSLAELEIYTYGSQESANATYIHRGCFTEFTFNSEFNFNDILGCRLLCMDDGTSVMAVSKPLGKCLCGYTFDETEEVSMATCSTTCPGLNVKCGGSNSYSVYIIRFQIPHSLGCTNAAAPSDISERIASMTIDKCMKHCWNYSNVWIKGESCVCFIGYLSMGDIFECDHKCAGDPENICGGHNHASVYGTCKGQSGEYFDCKKLLHCLGDDYDEYGECKRGCKHGFSGTYCIERVADSGDTPGEKTRKPKSRGTASTKKSKGQPARSNRDFTIGLAAMLLMFNFILF